MSWRIVQDALPYLLSKISFAKMLDFWCPSDRNYQFCWKLCFPFHIHERHFSESSTIPILNIFQKLTAFRLFLLTPFLEPILLDCCCRFSPIDYVTITFFFMDHCWVIFENIRINVYSFLWYRYVAENVVDKL